VTRGRQAGPPAAGQDAPPCCPQDSTPRGGGGPPPPPPRARAGGGGGGGGGGGPPPRSPAVAAPLLGGSGCPRTPPPPAAAARGSGQAAASGRCTPQPPPETRTRTRRPCCAALRCAVPCCAVLCCAVLCCAVMYWIAYRLHQSRCHRQFAGWACAGAGVSDAAQLSRHLQRARRPQQHASRSRWGAEERARATAGQLDSRSRCQARRWGGGRGAAWAHQAREVLTAVAPSCVQQAWQRHQRETGGSLPHPWSLGCSDPGNGSAALSAQG
jgi:hypothetical protein